VADGRRVANSLDVNFGVTDANAARSRPFCGRAGAWSRPLCGRAGAHGHSILSNNYEVKAEHLEAALTRSRCSFTMPRSIKPSDNFHTPGGV